MFHNNNGMLETLALNKGQREYVEASITDLISLEEVNTQEDLQSCVKNIILTLKGNNVSENWQFFLRATVELDVVASRIYQGKSGKNPKKKLIRQEIVHQLNESLKKVAQEKRLNLKAAGWNYEQMYRFVSKIQGGNERIEPLMTGNRDVRYKDMNGALKYSKYNEQQWNDLEINLIYILAMQKLKDQNSMSLSDYKKIQQQKKLQDQYVELYTELKRDLGVISWLAECRKKFAVFPAYYLRLNEYLSRKNSNDQFSVTTLIWYIAFYMTLEDFIEHPNINIENLEFLGNRKNSDNIMIVLSSLGEAGFKLRDLLVNYLPQSHLEYIIKNYQGIVEWVQESHDEKERSLRINQILDYSVKDPLTSVKRKQWKNIASISPEEKSQFFDEIKVEFKKWQEKHGNDKDLKKNIRAHMNKVSKEKPTLLLSIIQDIKNDFTHNLEDAFVKRAFKELISLNTKNSIERLKNFVLAMVSSMLWKFGFEFKRKTDAPILEQKDILNIVCYCAPRNFLLGQVLKTKI